METPDYTKEYPELSEEGKKKTQEIIDRFGKSLQDLANATFVSFTHNLSEQIVSDDSWVDLRSKVITALCGYNNRESKMAGTYEGQWWVNIRKKILEENREAIVTDILLDKEAEIRKLNEQIAYLVDQNSRRF